MGQHKLDKQLGAIQQQFLEAGVRTQIFPGGRMPGVKTAFQQGLYNHARKMADAIEQNTINRLTLKAKMAAQPKGIHRSTPNSKSGRRMINIGTQPQDSLTQEQKDWNARVEQKRAAKKGKK